MRARLASPARAVAVGGLLTAAAFHVRWAEQTRRGTLPDDFADVTIGEGARVPPPWMTIGVAAALTAMAGSVARGGRLGTLTGSILLARGLAGFVLSGPMSPTPRTRFQRRDLAAYSPITTTLGLASVLAA